ncbi:MAG: transcription termination/antitermination protein NusA [Chloroflexi bacterium CFX4]|nr:transcription termination/antitermination protein NusA [Chloroflexi bacterium CFX4]MDL1923573.1 transcription termination/antitermination protein NusA [Chloroflexi bacterium CFX3]
MAKSDFTLAFNEITEAHHLPREVVVEALKQALVSAFRRDSGVSSAQRVEAEVDPTTNRYRVLLEKEVVDDSTEGLSDKTEITLSEARLIVPEAEVGDVIMAPQETNTKTFGRIAAQTAKQVILQKIREAERSTLYEEYKGREGELIVGQVQSINNQTVTVMLNGRAEATLPAKEQIRNERFKQGDKIRLYVMEVRESTRGPQIIVSRAHRNMLRRLFEFEVPEIYHGQVEIKNIAREPGQRSKVAVAALQPGIDPVGACVGQRGIRIQTIVKELNDERIDVIEWNADPSIFIAKALSPAHTNSQYVYLEEDIDQGNTATVIVGDDQLSLAIGREGQNARLAAKLTGWRIDIKSVSEAAFDAQARLAEPPLEKLAAENPDLIAEVARILEKKRAERTVMPEEYQTLSRFVHMAETRLLDHRITELAERRKRIERAKAELPRRIFQMQLEELELEDDILKAIKTRSILNVGDLMARLQAEESVLLTILEAAKVKDGAAEALNAIKDAIESLVPNYLNTPEPPPDPEVEVAAAAEADAVPALERAASLAAPADEALDEEAPPAFLDVEAPSAPRPALPVLPPVPSKPRRPQPAAPEPAATILEPELEEESKKDRKGKGKPAKPAAARDLIYDEERGETVRLRKHKRRGGRDWEDYEE